MTPRYQANLKQDGRVAGSGMNQGYHTRGTRRYFTRRMHSV
jgi:hypothetical protein